MAQQSHPANRLADETSPYLLQHAHNPVAWWPWCDEAFAEARRKDLPVFLSIGYSTCHWCHVMERESFENAGIAQILNQHFIAVKVDREERPDVDAIYMDALLRQAGSGGWPMSIFLDHDRNPFYCATYIPPTPRYGRAGFPELLAAIADAWAHRRGEVLEHAKASTAALQEPRPHQAREVDLRVCDLAAEQLAHSCDPEAGGWGSRTKFPMPHRLCFLLRYHQRSARAPQTVASEHHHDVLALCTDTLDHMLRGGIRDHVGGGFHRYSTDPHWHLPHFEKMLYDQAQMALALTETFQLTRDARFADAARELFGYVLRDLHDPQGGFWSAEDADSQDAEGNWHEGLFYLWSTHELAELLGEADAETLARLFGCSGEGNFLDESTGKKLGLNLLHLVTAAELPPQSRSWLERNRYLATVTPLLERLRARRNTRLRPRLDDKVLASWNGLMLSALAVGARVLAEPTYLEAARGCARFMLEQMRDGQGELLHSWRKAPARIEGMLADYAACARGLLDLYAASFEPQWLLASLDLARRMCARFEDREGGGFFSSREGQADLITRRKEAYDGAEPSGNSLAAEVLARLSRLSGDVGLGRSAQRTFQAFGAELHTAPSHSTQMLIGLEAAAGPGVEVVVVAKDIQQAGPMLEAIHAEFRPQVEVLILTDAWRREIEGLAPFVRDYRAMEGKATAYVCRHSVCDAPTTEVAVLLGRL